MLLAILMGFLITPFIPWLYKNFTNSAGFIVSLLPLGLFLYFLSYVPQVLAGNPVVFEYSWFPSLDIQMRFYLDGLSLVFAMIISGVGWAVFLFASKYMNHYPFYDRFYIYISIFMASMLGVVTADNMIAMFVFWELTSISSFLLIGFNHHTGESRYNALQALLVTGGGGLAMLAGFIMINIVTGSQDFSSLAASQSLIHSSPLYLAILVTVLLGAFTKSAQVPFHFWLPNAMVAPTPVSAYLHSATMVKAGVYLMARLNPSLGGTLVWEYTLIIFGGLTMFTGAYLAIKQTDLKKLLAYTTLSVLGTLTMLIGIGTPLALQAIVIYLIAHSLYKGSLFLVAGSVDYSTGTRDITLIGGLRKYMPITAIAGTLAGLSMMGFIPMIGFIGKEALYEAVLGHSNYGLIIFAVTMLSSIFMVAVAGFTGIKPFYHKESFPDKTPKESYWQMWLGPLVLASLGLVFGLFPQFTINALTLFTTGNLYGREIYGMYVSLWHGFNIILVLSLVTVLFGAILYYYRLQLFGILSKMKMPKFLLPSEIYGYLLQGLINFAKLQTQIIQNGNLRSYLSIVIAITILITGYSLLNFNDLSDINLVFDVTFYEVTIALIIISATIMVVRSEKRLATIAGLGVVGFGVSIIFVLYGGPDLALTQFAVETLTVILFVLVLYKLPRFVRFSSLKHRIRDFFLAATFGVMMMTIILLVTSYSLPDYFKIWFSENSYTHAYGRNIVNVILVDFRAMDTMGEIIVLVVAALGVYSLLKLRDDEPIEEENK